MKVRRQNNHRTLYNFMSYKVVMAIEIEKKIVYYRGSRRVQPGMGNKNPEWW